MKQQEEYKLDEAIKKFYTTEPLKADLATTVADKVFEKHKKAYPLLRPGSIFLLAF